MKTFYEVAAFSDNVKGGNFAGVVLDGNGYKEKEMQTVAAEVGHSETAFVMNSDKADYKVRFFTPAEQTDIC